MPLRSCFIGVSFWWLPSARISSHVLGVATKTGNPEKIVGGRFAASFAEHPDLPVNAEATSEGSARSLGKKRSAVAGTGSTLGEAHRVCTSVQEPKQGDFKMEPNAVKGTPVTRQCGRKGPRGPRPAVHPRVPWTRGLSAAEAKRPGALLLALLIQRANEQGLTLKGMAEEVGVTAGYIAQLRNGMRAIPDVSKDFLAGCAGFLKIPVIQCAMAAGKFSIEDFYAAREPEEQVEAALKFIQNDSVVGGMMPMETYSASRAVKFFVLMLFEVATGKKVLSSRASTLCDLLDVS